MGGLKEGKDYQSDEWCNHENQILFFQNKMIFSPLNFIRHNLYKNYFLNNIFDRPYKF